MTSATPTADSTVDTVAKKIQAFYTPKAQDGESAAIPVSLWVVEGRASGAPDFDGTIGEQRVSVRIRNGSKGIFLAVNKTLTADLVRDDGFQELSIGSANVVINERGFPMLAIKLTEQKDKTVWANVSQKVSEELLVKAGLDLGAMAQKKAAYEANKQTKDAAAV